MHGECLDSNIVIAIIEGEPAALQRLQSVAETYLPFIVLGELLYGVELSTRREANRGRLENVLRDLTLLLPDARTAFFYARIRAQLKRRGRPIPENDIWIAAMAMQYDLQVATRDAHFREIEGLMVNSWE